MTVHRYEPLWKNGPDREIPSPTAFTFRDADDVGRFAALDALTTAWRFTRPEGSTGPIGKSGRR